MTVARQRYSDEELAGFGLLREAMPAHVAIIMDGNGRWARSRGLPRIEGHRRGVKTVRRTVEESSSLGLKQLTLYCFSNENWKRPKRELSLLMHLLRQYVVEERAEIMRQNLRFRVIGRINELDAATQREISRTEELSSGNSGMCLCLAVNYGGRQEITDAVRHIVQKAVSGELDPNDIDEQTVTDHLYTAGMTDPDLLVRTASEMRVSNYLLWQISYAEFWVTDKFWPDFEESDLHDALRNFGTRDRRFGALKEPQ